MSIAAVLVAAVSDWGGANLDAKIFFPRDEVYRVRFLLCPSMCMFHSTGRDPLFRRPATTQMADFCSTHPLPGFQTLQIPWF